MYPSSDVVCSAFASTMVPLASRIGVRIGGTVTMLAGRSSDLRRASTSSRSFVSSFEPNLSTRALIAGRSPVALIRCNSASRSPSALRHAVASFTTKNVLPARCSTTMAPFSRAFPAEISSARR